MVEIAVVGSNEFVIGFRLAGIQKTLVAEDDEALKTTVQHVLDDASVGILVLDSSDMNRLPLRLRALLEESVKPTVIAIGEEEGGLSMRERIKRSVGVDLWK
ncbi:V-type ATP synthase subunit F [Methanofollis aquaemaris]|uniref:A-type ATP synthase subunit F n=1 Tax=Methanofollis aquaemaris TaxID=126734 RepID=A0A8A3S6H5_9EURY|nr:V-type ATP synthase subunit F [Methanofollis aquaemaris]QSZ67652.1 V-type ATP synthase subunit F [Methanofollis aquaemaris]